MTRRYVVHRSFKRALACIATVLCCLVTASASAQQVKAKYLGGTLGTTRAGESPLPNLLQFNAKCPEGLLDMSSTAEMSFVAGPKVSIVIPYDAIDGLIFGVDPSHRGSYWLPWDSYQQYTGKRHYLLTIVFHEPGGREHAVAFELDKTAVRSTIDRLERLSGRRTTITNAVACTSFRSAADCGHWQPERLRGLTTVYLDASTEVRDAVTAEIASAGLSLTMVEDPKEAAIIARYTGATVMEARAGKMMAAGRGEVQVMAADGPHVVMVFEDLKTSVWEKPPVVNFARAFVEVYKAASAAK